MTQRYEHIRKEVPFLRRFGRAMTGQQRFADACVVTLMDQLLDGMPAVTLGVQPRIDLYRRYLAALGAYSCDWLRCPFEVQFSSHARQMHWLNVVEHFSEEMLSTLFQKPPHYVRGQLDLYRMELAQQSSVTVEIIEDEALIAYDLKRLLISMRHNVTAIAKTREEAVTLFERDAPRLILSDVQLADGSSGIDAIRDIGRRSEVPVVFITSFPELLLTGKGDEPAFLINKPFDPKVVKAVVSQALYLAQRQLPALEVPGEA